MTHGHPVHHAHGHTTFEELMASVIGPDHRFGHREHVHVTWLAVRRFGTPVAGDLIDAGIRRTTRYAGVPQKYNATVSRAWVELIAHHATAHATDDFSTFARANPELFDKRLLTRFYRAATLAGQQARTGWVEPDLAPFPWNDPGRAELRS